MLDNAAHKASKRIGVKQTELLALWLEKERKTKFVLKGILDSKMFDLCMVNGRIYYAGNCDSLQDYLEDIRISTFYPEEMVAVIYANSMYGIPEVDIDISMR